MVCSRQGKHSLSALPRPLTAETLLAGTDVAAGHIFTGATIHTRVGFALVVVDVAVCPAPAWVTIALVAVVKKRNVHEHVPEHVHV